MPGLAAVEVEFGLVDLQFQHVPSSVELEPGGLGVSRHHSRDVRDGGGLEEADANIQVVQSEAKEFLVVEVLVQDPGFRDR